MGRRRIKEEGVKSARRQERETVKTDVVQHDARVQLASDLRQAHHRYRPSTPSECRVINLQELPPALGAITSSVTSEVVNGVNPALRASAVRPFNCGRVHRPARRSGIRSTHRS